MAPDSLTGFLAIGVYYASLAFWSYGVVSRAENTQPTGNPTPLSTQGPTAFLDAEEVADVSKFVTLDCGLPALQGPSGPTFLADPGMMMQVVQRVLHLRTGSLPPDFQLEVKRSIVGIRFEYDATVELSVHRVRQSRRALKVL
jgi:hypothetical protein